MTQVNYIRPLGTHEPSAACQRCGSLYNVSDVSREKHTGLRVCYICLDDPPPPEVRLKPHDVYLPDPLPFVTQTRTANETTLPDKVDALSEKPTGLTQKPAALPVDGRQRASYADVVDAFSRTWNNGCK